MMADWIAVDWGTSHVRAWALDDGGRILAERSSADGMGVLEPSGFEPALLRLIADWLPAPGSAPLPVIACGMVGARQGWHEAPYRPVPCTPVGTGAPCAAPRTSSGFTLTIVPGLSQARPFDVMRGEEAQIAGLLSRVPEFDGVACLPGTHTKWVHLSAGEVVSFQTGMTGEIFALLAGRSVLRHSVGADTVDPEAFRAAVIDVMTSPQTFAARLFSIRAEALLADLSPQRARGRLSGLLVGLDLAAAKPYWLGREVVIVGAPGLSALYARALAAAGVTASVRDAAEMTLAGLAVARGLAERG